MGWQLVTPILHSGSERLDLTSRGPLRERIADRIRQENKAEECRRRKLLLMDLVRREITAYARQLREDFEYEDTESPVSIERRTRGEVEKTLAAELSGSETDTQVRSRMRELMEEAEGCK